MAPIPAVIPHPSSPNPVFSPLHPRHPFWPLPSHYSSTPLSTIYHRRSNGSSDDPLSNGPFISLVITTIILSILIIAATAWLGRLLWLRYLLPRRELRKSEDLLQAEKTKMESFDDVEVAAAVAVGNGASGLEGAGAGAAGHRKRSSAGGRGIGHGQAKGERRGRSYSDELWCSSLAKEGTDSSSSDDDDDDGDNHGQRYPKQVYGIARGSGRGLATQAARRSRFLSLGGAPAVGFQPLGMHPVREADFVDVPLRAGGGVEAAKETEKGNNNGAAVRIVVGDDEFGQGSTIRESWPLRTTPVVR